MSVRIGSVVGIELAPLVYHEGVISGTDWDGTLLVINASQRSGFALEERLEVFAGGQPVHDLGYPSAMPSNEVIRRARALIGRPWNLLTSNCKDLVRHAHGLGYVGKVVTVIGVVALFAGAVAAVRALRR